MDDQTGYVRRIIMQDPSRMKALAAARALNLPDWWIGGGFVRNAVWDALHDYDTTTLNDIDLVYFDPHNINETTENCYKTALQEATGQEWDVKNQARMHVKYGREQYANSADAMSYWVETATCIGVNLDEFDIVRICAPCGLDDLLQGIVRHNPRFGHKDIFDKRWRSKGWLTQWPHLRIVEDQ